MNSLTCRQMAEQALKVMKAEYPERRLALNGNGLVIGDFRSGEWVPFRVQDLSGRWISAADFLSKHPLYDLTDKWEELS